MILNGGRILEYYSLIQIGDIHYQYIDKSIINLDCKDKTYPNKLINILPKPIIQKILKDLLLEINKDPIGIFICGDLTTQGKINFYSDCLNFLKERIPQKIFEEHSEQKIFIVPGNHDIDWNLICDDKLAPKFKPIKDSLRKNGFPTVPHPNLITETYPKNASKRILVIALNSCLGCGEKRYYPEEFHNELTKIIKSLKGNKNNQEKINKLCYERIDSPIINEKDIELLSKTIASTDKSCLPILLAHHNLLPQRTPRVAIYPELINSGYIRDVLLKLDRPILYLHGHIHDNPIEIIQSSKYKDARIICISAPLLVPNSYFNTGKVGFNKIKIFYGKHDMPIGCEVKNYVLNSSNQWENNRGRIPLVNNKRAIVYADKESIEILKIIDGTMHLGTLQDKIEEKLGKKISLDEIAKSIDMLDWLGSVEFDHDDSPLAQKWVRRVIP